MNLLQHYMRLRVPNFSPYGDKRLSFQQTATSALRGARWALAADSVREAWDDSDGFEISEYDRYIDSAPGASLECLGPVRLRLVPDETCCLDDLLGDRYNHEVNSNIKPEILDRERAAYIERIENDGVCGVVGEYWNGQAWEHADSCFGFVGDDWRESGYDSDIMSTTLDAWNAHLESAAREIERERPDMYEGV